jgi:putative hydrolase of the HAD superfamily
MRGILHPDRRLGWLEPGHMPVPKNLILDLDDTILDYTAPAIPVWLRLYDEFAPKMNLPVEQLQRAVDDSRRWYWSDADRFREGRLDLKRARRILVRRAFSALGRTDLETADELADAFSVEREIAVRPFDGAVETLETFQQNGSRMVLLTNGESALQRAKIERFQLGRFFEAVFIESETGIGKPDPRAHRSALAALGAAPQQAWMIGDDLECDIRPARALGMRAAWVRNRPAGRPDAADVVVPSLRALIDAWNSSAPVYMG